MISWDSMEESKQTRVSLRENPMEKLGDLGVAG